MGREVYLSFKVDFPSFVFISRYEYWDMRSVWKFKKLTAGYLVLLSEEQAEELISIWEEFGEGDQGSQICSLSRQARTGFTK